MTYTVYIDVVLFVNAVMDFVVLAILNRILDSGAGWGRLLSGAAVGGLWACLVLSLIHILISKLGHSGLHRSGGLMLVQSGGDHRDGRLILCVLIIHRTKDNIRIISGQLLNICLLYTSRCV